MEVFGAGSRNARMLLVPNPSAQCNRKATTGISAADGQNHMASGIHDIDSVWAGQKNAKGLTDCRVERKIFNGELCGLSGW